MYLVGDLLDDVPLEDRAIAGHIIDLRDEYFFSINSPRIFVKIIGFHSCASLILRSAFPPCAADGAVRKAHGVHRTAKLYLLPSPSAVHKLSLAFEPGSHSCAMWK